MKPAPATAVIAISTPALEEPSDDSPEPVRLAIAVGMDTP